MRPPLSKVDTNKSNGKSAASTGDFGAENIQQIGPQDVKILSHSRLSPDSFDDWGPSEYQELLTTMVGNIADDVQDAALGPSKSKSRSPGSSQSDSPRGALVPYQRPGFLRSPDDVATPSKFSITSVEPLHFLGITPTYESGELLQACEFSRYLAYSD